MVTEGKFVNPATKANLIRFAIPILRILPSFAGLYGVAGLYHLGWRHYIVFAQPLQKVFYAPLVQSIWEILALIPFILLWNTSVFRIYTTLFTGCLAFMAYDYVIPFRYVSPKFHGTISDAGGGFSSSGNPDDIAFWVSYPTFPPSAEDCFLVIVRIAPLALAFVYRRYFRLWAPCLDRVG